MRITLEGEGIDDLRSKCMHFLGRTLSLEEWQRKKGYTVRETVKPPLVKKTPSPLNVDPRTIPNVEEGKPSLVPRSVEDINAELPYPAVVLDAGDRWTIGFKFREDKHFNEMRFAVKRLGARWNKDNKVWELVKQ